MLELTLTDMVKKQGKCLSIAISMSIMIAFILLQPTHIEAQPGGINGQQNVSISSIPAIAECKIDPSAQPMDPVDMNSVIFRTLVKTVHVEKEILSCKTLQGPPIILDISIYTEIIENIQTPGAEALKKSFEVITCGKTFDGTILGCVPKDIEPNAPLPQNLTCTIQTPSIPFPIEMNTVVGPVDVGRFVKTIQAETEIFKCDPLPNGDATKIKMVTIFTEIFEDLAEMRVLNKAIDSVTCVKDIANATVITCTTKRIT
jgi:hypothetical protein